MLALFPSMTEIEMDKSLMVKWDLFLDWTDGNEGN